jgi:hypothetical protein
MGPGLPVNVDRLAGADLILTVKSEKKIKQRK